MSDHISKEGICKCEYCTMIDVMFGDPLLNKWETEFIESVAQQGWQRNYTDNQKAKIKQIFNKQKNRYINNGG